MPEAPAVTHPPRLAVWRRAWQCLRPDEVAWRGAAAAAAAMTLALLFSFAHELTAGAWTAITIAVVVPLGIGLGVVSGTLVTLTNILAGRIPRSALATITGCVIVLSTLVFGRRNSQVIAILVGGVLLPAMILGAGVWSVLRHRREAQSPGRRALALGSIVTGGALLCTVVAWYNWPGPHIAPAYNAALSSGAPVPSIAAPNPSDPGPYRVLQLAYGNGTDRYRPEYGAQVGLRTPTVDASFLLPSWRGLTGWLRSVFWGFGPAALPLNARVWYPAGAGPFPLVLIVHGNHHMMDFSDSGYEYLGRLLASRGIIMASVGENYLNMSWTDIRMFGIQGLVDEEAARGWLLLQHLEQFRRWNSTPGTPFTGKVDLDRIALMGHSRGGEAAIIAAEMNHLPCDPEDARHPYEYHFHIRSVVALAPSEGIYAPAGHEVVADSIDYLAIQGGYDGDVTPFAGIRQYNRIRLTDNRFHFKTAVYVDRANHGQFNSSWGRADRSGFPDKGLLNLSSILPEPAQQHIAMVYISAFLEASLRDNHVYLPLFRDARAGKAWLPETVYLSRYSDTRTRLIAHFEEDANLRTTSDAEASLAGDGLSMWHEGRVALKYGDANTHAAYLGWHRGAGDAAPFFAAVLSPRWQQPGEHDALVFSLADVRRSLAELTESSALDAGAGPATRTSEGPLDMSIELVDRAGHIARVPLDRFSLLQPQLEYYPLKARILKSSDGLPYEPTFQRFEFPLAWFRDANRVIDTSQLAQIRFVFDRSPAGLIEIDNIGVRQPDEAASPHSAP